MPNVTSQEIDEFLAHHGVKGMHWGVRKARESSGSVDGSEKSSANHAKLKKVAVIGGTVAGVALIAAGTYYLAKHGDLPASSLNFGNTEKAKNLVEEFAKEIPREPTSVIHASRGKNLGFTFLKKGGLSDPINEYDKAGFNFGKVNVGEHRRYGDHLEKVAVSFLDPEGRIDSHGRPIPHEVILPKIHAEDVTDFESAKNKAWSLVKDDYEKFHKKSAEGI